MALTKLLKAGLATEPVSTSQIEDGTIQTKSLKIVHLQVLNWPTLP